MSTKDLRRELGRKELFGIAGVIYAFLRYRTGKVHMDISYEDD